MEQPVFFDSWTSLGRVLLVGTIAYVALVAMLRVSGKRTLSKMNAFDLIVTVALGSTLATVLLSRSVPLLDGITALGLLIGLQYVITWASIRSERFQHLIKAEPTMVLSQGTPLPDALRRQRVTMEEVHAAIRGAGHDGIDRSISVVLETDGSLSVLKTGG
ncbi:MAG: DUF421 domain-containing protein [Alphaproteobacteria bacterium]|nr:DUF421 domain-containing protein [Alphaproteobacteria bacterium]